MAYLIKFWRFRYKLYKHQKACFYMESVVRWLADDTQINYYNINKEYLLHGESVNPHLRFENTWLYSMNHVLTTNL